MSTVFRAVVENGTLRPLDPVDLAEGQEIEVMILSDQAGQTPDSGSQLALFADDEAEVGARQS